MSNSKYEVSTKTIETLLSPNSSTFEIPVFQRPYSWRREQIDQLMDDIFTTPPEELPYFLGSIVLADKDKKTSDSRIVILDGQQRLTTITLLIYAFIHKLKLEGLEDIVEHKRYISSKPIKGKRELKIKLQQGEDKNAYEAILSDEILEPFEKYKSTSIVKALKSIFDYIEKNKKNSSLEDMFQRLLCSVELVCITASSERDAFRLFETLNDRGLSLSSADLIKNKIFSKCSENTRDEAVESWSNITEYTQDDDIVKFLRHYWISAHGNVRKRQTYETYREHLETLNEEESIQFIASIEESASYFEQIINPNPRKCIWGAEVAEVLDRLLSYRATQVRPFILALAKHSPEHILTGVKICESITVRSSIIGSRNPSSIEKVYFELSQMLQKEDPWRLIFESKVLKDIVSDEEFVEDFSSISVASVTPALREILSQVNAAMSTGETYIQKGKQVHVEHIFPQKPSIEALQESGIKKSDVSDYSCRIGNLTLLSGAYNRKASNKAFSLKRSIYEKSDILMTRKLASFEHWGVKEIDHRSNELSDFAVQAYPHPIEIIKSSFGESIPSLCELETNGVEIGSSEEAITTQELCSRFGISYSNYRQQARRFEMEPADWLSQKTGWNYIGNRRSRRWVQPGSPYQ
jgi:hypothetical protein